MTAEEILSVIAAGMDDLPSRPAYIALATQRTDRCFFGVNYTLAIALRAAHEWVLNTRRQGESGVTTYEASGRLAKSYGGVGVIRDSLQLTNYGMQLEALIKESGMGATISNEDIYNLYIGGECGI